jgi:signal peptidase
MFGDPGGSVMSFDAARLRRLLAPGRLLLVGWAVAIGLCAIQVLSGGYQAHPVLTGSMRPGFALGSVVVVKRVPVSSLATRDVIMFHNPGSPSEYVVHRIVSLQSSPDGKVIETKGDDNPVRDPWKFTLRGRTAYRAEFTIPFIGYAALWLHQPGTLRLFVHGAALLLALAAGYVLLKKDKDPDAQPQDAQPQDAQPQDAQPQGASRSVTQVPSSVRR